VDKFNQLVNLCRAHNQQHTTDSGSFQLEFIVKFLQLSGADLRRFANYMAQYPRNGDGA
jgi:hypothetical protein